MKKEPEVKSEHDSARDSLINVISSSLSRAGEKDTRGVLMMIAALSLLSMAKESGLAMAAARKLATSGGRK